MRKKIVDESLESAGIAQAAIVRDTSNDKNDRTIGTIKQNLIGFNSTLQLFDGAFSTSAIHRQFNFSGRHKNALPEKLN